MEKAADSPLRTQQSRDRLVRRPLSELAKTPAAFNSKKSNVVEEEDDVDNFTPPLNITTRKSKLSRRSGKISPNSHLSPPDSTVYASSPNFDLSKAPRESPQMSMISPKENKKSPSEKNDSSCSRRRSSSRSRNKSASKSQTKQNISFDSSSQTEDETDETPTRVLRSRNSKNISAPRKNLSKMSNTANESMASRNRSKLNKSDEKSSVSWCSILVWLIIIVGSGVVYKFHSSGELQEFFDDLNKVEDVTEIIASGRGDSFQRFKRDLEKIRADFPNQNPTYWGKINSQVRKIMYGRAKEPSCILLMQNETARSTNQCLIKNLGKAVYSAMNKGDMDGQVTTIIAKDLPQDPIEAKAELFENMSKNLRNHYVVILEDINDLSADAAMALHGICDEGFMYDENLKPVVFMTITDNRSEAELKKGMSEFEHVSDRINNLWQKDLGEDKVAPLISRISATPLKIIAEDVQASKFCSK